MQADFTPREITKLGVDFTPRVPRSRIVERSIMYPNKTGTLLHPRSRGGRGKPLWSRREEKVRGETRGPSNGDDSGGGGGGGEFRIMFPVYDRARGGTPHKYLLENICP